MTEPTVLERLARVSARIAATGRNPDEVAIVAVTKGFGVEICREALAAGLHVLGENRVQEALAKMETVPSAQWHLIGHLQTNKVRQAAGRFALIQTVDSARLAEFGADLALDSSDPEWVEQVLGATGGRGVDVVVDQLSGATANRTLAAIEPRPYSAR